MHWLYLGVGSPMYAGAQGFNIKNYYCTGIITLLRNLSRQWTAPRHWTSWFCWQTAFPLPLLQCHNILMPKKFPIIPNASL